MCVPAATTARERPGGARAAARTVARGGRVLSVCSGAFILALPGSSTGAAARRTGSTSTSSSTSSRRHDVVPDVLYVDDDPVVTSAGTAAGIDACLHLVREELGAEVANGIARRMVVPPHREGGQAQYVDNPVAACASEALSPVAGPGCSRTSTTSSRSTTWPRRRTCRREPSRAGSRPRPGSTPHAWLTAQRVLHAEQLLEQTDDSDRAGGRAGRLRLGDAAPSPLRAARGTTPQSYRRTFRQSA